MPPSGACGPGLLRSGSRRDKNERVFTDAAFSIPPNVIFEAVEDETILLDLDSGVYFSLNSLASRIWRLIEEHGRIPVVVERLLAEYDVAPERLEADLERVLGELTDRRLLDRRPLP